MFDGTTESLLELVADLSIQREQRLAASLHRYETQAEMAGVSSDPGVLKEAQHILQQRLGEGGPRDHELVHLAVLLCYYTHEWEPLLQVLTGYRQQPLDLYELAWTWWYQIDCLALLKRDAQVIEEQQAFLVWAQQHLPPDHWLFLWNDNTQAMCWLAHDEEQRWFAQCFALLEQVAPTDANRYDRFLLLRSALTLLLRLERPREARQILRSLHRIEREDPCWPRQAELHLHIVALQVQFLALDPERYGTALRALTHHAARKLDRWLNQTAVLTLQQRRTVRRLAHNIGAELFFAHHYDLAIPFFEQAVRHGSMSLHTYLWLAASLWIRQKEKQRGISLLRQAQALIGDQTRFQYLLQGLPELACFPYGEV